MIPLHMRIQAPNGIFGKDTGPRGRTPYSIICHSANRRTKEPRIFADPALPLNERRVFCCAVFNLIDAQCERPETRDRLDGLVVTWLGRLKQCQQPLAAP